MRRAIASEASSNQWQLISATPERSTKISYQEPLYCDLRCRWGANPTFGTRDKSLVPRPWSVRATQQKITGQGTRTRFVKKVPGPRLGLIRICTRSKCLVFKMLKRYIESSSGTIYLFIDDRPRLKKPRVSAWNQLFAFEGIRHHSSTIGPIGGHGWGHIDQMPPIWRKVMPPDGSKRYGNQGTAAQEVRTRGSRGDHTKQDPDTSAGRDHRSRPADSNAWCFSDGGRQIRVRRCSVFA